ncbi:sensor histidine kinase [Dyadobacter sp. OTU695]|uniref:sensor histidine kinase n=1 Tax=Dyadobacter sp. OTU695 TaxID=3043860 RepID=UPI00313DD4F8
MKKYNLQLGASIAAVLTLSILPVRLSEGQSADPVNLIGSEIGIWLMCMSIWLVSYHTYYRANLAKWQRIAVSLVFCAILSNLFYYVSNPFFEDYPLKPIRELPFWIAVIRLSVRGLLIGLFMIPVIYLVEMQRQRQMEALQRERDRTIEAEKQKHVLELLVSKRTAELEQTLSVLSKSQDELDHQVYLLTRIVASIAHDVNAPLKFIISGAGLIGKLIGDKQWERAAEYNQQLEHALGNMATFMGNLLEFAKGQIHKGALKMDDVNLAALVREKAGLFEPILSAKHNMLHLAVEENLTVANNSHLLGVILHNLLDNAAKNTQNGEIEIVSAIVEDRLHLRIQNDVQGAYAYESVLKGLPGQGDVNIAEIGKDSDGLGLVLVRDISALLNVGFSIEMTAGKVIAAIVFPEFSGLEDNSARAGEQINNTRKAQMS